MRTSEERVMELHRRMNQFRKTSTDRRIYTMFAVLEATGLAIAALFAVLVSSLPIQLQASEMTGTTASIFTENAALGYVVTALLAFALGTLLTILCFRLKERMKEENTDERTQ